MKLVSTLSPHQLADILNFLLGLPVKKGVNGGLVRRDGLHPCLTFSWGMKVRARAEHWAETALRTPDAYDGRMAIPEPLEIRLGRKRRMPKELNPWIWTTSRERLQR